MTDETPTHRRVMEKARAEIERLTRELAEVRLHAKAHHTELVDALRQATDERDAARQERDAALADSRGHDRTIEARDRAQETVAEVAAILGCESEWTNAHDHHVCVVELAHEVTEERAALRAIMPSEEEITGLLALRVARFDGGQSEVYAKAAPYLDRLALARLSPPSAPAQDGGE